MHKSHFYLKSFLITFQIGSYLHFKKNIIITVGQNYGIKIRGGEVMETAKMSGGTMLVLGIIIAIIIVLIPAFIYIYAWIAAILLIIGGLFTMLSGG